MELDLTLGCLLLSVVFSAIFFGVLTVQVRHNYGIYSLLGNSTRCWVQVHIYFDKYKKDSWDIRGIVSAAIDLCFL